MNNKCPKCGKKISPFYLKQNCPHCNVDLLYYKLDERLEADAKESERQVNNLKRFAFVLRSSTIATPLHIIRLMLFFTPLASMCLPMFWAGHKNVSLIAFIASIINHGFDFSAMAADKSYFFAVLAMLGVIVFSLAVIISSLFSATKKGFQRNMIFSIINALVLSDFGAAVYYFGGRMLIGFFVTELIYAIEFILHYFCEKPKDKSKLLSIISAVLLVVYSVTSFAVPFDSQYYRSAEIEKNESAISVVSFNLASPWGSSIDDTASADRVVRFAEYMKAASPDLIGTQELNSNWLSELGKLLPEYESYAVKRGGDENEIKSEMNGIFWKKDAFTAIKTNTFWLSQTPEKESRFTFTDENGEKREAGCNRICSYAILKENKSGKTIAFLNTHLDNSSEEAIAFSAELICTKIAQIRESYSDIQIILTGDFNQTEDGIFYKKITSVLNDTTNREKQKATWQDWGYTSTGDKPIDFIFTSAKADNYLVLDNLSLGYVSDHYGIESDIILE